MMPCFLYIIVYQYKTFVAVYGCKRNDICRLKYVFLAHISFFCAVFMQIAHQGVEVCNPVFYLVKSVFLALFVKRYNSV